MQIGVIGASGWVGGAVARETLSRGHSLTAIVRNPVRVSGLDGAEIVECDARDAVALAQAISGHDVIVSAASDRSTADRSTIPTVARALIEAAASAGGPRVAFVGGGGSLRSSSGERFVDRQDFPDAYRPEALACAEALEAFRAAPESLEWTYLSPPPQGLERAEQRGGYRAQGGDEPIRDADGNFGITSGDLASALLDEIEQPRFRRQRWTVGY